MEHIDNELERLNQQLHSQTSTESIDNGTRTRYSHDIVKLLIVLFEIYIMGLVFDRVTVAAIDMCNYGSNCTYL